MNYFFYTERTASIKTFAELNNLFIIAKAKFALVDTLDSAILASVDDGEPEAARIALNTIRDKERAHALAIEETIEEYGFTNSLRMYHTAEDATEARTVALAK